MTMTCENCFREIPPKGLTAVYADEDGEIIEVTAECQCGARHFRFIGTEEFDWEK